MINKCSTVEELIVETKYFTFADKEKFTLESGKKLGPITVAYQTYGTLNPPGDNGILVLHALTGDAHAAGVHGETGQEGWWNPLIGPGKPLDTNKYFIVCSNVLGGCKGTTGPASINSETGKPYAMDFPVITIRDMVRVQEVLIRDLGIKHMPCIIGGSMGGMLALEWAVSFPEYMDKVIAIATAGRLTAQNIAFNEVGRRAIMNDPNWQYGNYYGESFPTEGLALARMIGTITYKSDQSMNRRFARNSAQEAQDYFAFASQFAVESYLHYQGQKLVQRFDANTYLYLCKAMDLHDLGRGYKSYEEAIKRIKAKVLMVGVSSDFLYPPYQQKEIYKIMANYGQIAYYEEIISPHGHDAFLIEFQKLNHMVESFLQKKTS